jgi:hypothetical protein
LAWQAAMARDLPLLVNVTMLVALAITAVMAVAEIATSLPSWQGMARLRQPGSAAEAAL